MVSWQVAAALIEHNAPLTATTKKGFTALHLAAKYGNLKVNNMKISILNPRKAFRSPLPEICLFQFKLRHSVFCLLSSASNHDLFS